MNNVESILNMIVVLEFILSIAAVLIYCDIFRKAGESGWKAVIPIYGFCILGKIALGKAGNIGVFLGVFITINLLLWVAYKYVFINMQYNVRDILYILLCVSNVYLSSRFKRGIIFKILICLPIVYFFCLCYLAFNKNCVYHKD